MDYYNSLSYGLPKYHPRKLQLLQNVAARFETGAQKFDHISPLLGPWYYFGRITSVPESFQDTSFKFFRTSFAIKFINDGLVYH